jgi:low temperature requirement protein LtrA
MVGVGLQLWALALAIEYLSPAVRFWIPKYGASEVADWVVGHMAERCAGFIIIALGESIVVIGATFAELAWTLETVGAFMSAFIGSLAMWWIYFHKGAEAGSEQISRSSEPGRLARLAYTYLHMPIVAGIIVTAVADELGCGRATARRVSLRSLMKVREVRNESLSGARPVGE